MEKNLENQLLELMNRNHRKFSELIEKSASIFREKYNKEIYIKNREKLRILDGSVPQDYFTSLEMIEEWMDKCIDEIRNYIKPISYPLFVYLYLDLILRDSWSEAKTFFSLYSSKFVAFQEELEQLSLLKEPLNLNAPIVSNYLKNKVHIYIPRTTFDFFIHFLNTNNLILILDVLNKYFERSNLLSKIGSDTFEGENDKFVLLNLTGDELEKINGRTAIYYNKIRKDIDIQNKGKGRSKGEKNILSKVIIPLPEQINELVPMEVNVLKIDKKNPPTVGCFTILNSQNKMNCADMSQDGSIICCGFKDGSIMVWVLDKDMDIEINENVLKALDEFKDPCPGKILAKKEEPSSMLHLSQDRDNANKNEEGFVFQEITKRHRKFKFLGHTDSIYSVSISQDKENIVSGSFDETIRLWNIHTKSTLAIFKGHFAPVLSVKFSPMSHYFASGGSDRTARLWAMNCPGPLRIFVGHLSDIELVDFHPNSLYLITSANDKTIRLWSLENGESVRIFYNYTERAYIDCLCFSNSGKLMAIGCDQSIVLYDLVKMGDPVSIVKNLTNKSISSMSFDNEDNAIVVSTEDYKVLFYDLESILNNESKLKIDNRSENKIELIYSYMTKKTTILTMRFTMTNILLILGRFDDNDPKIFM